MAIYKVQGPDGKEHELEGPEGATDDQIIAKAQEAFGQQETVDPVEANREAIEPGIMNETSPTGQRLLENAAHAGEGYGMAQLAGVVGKAGVGLAAKKSATVRNSLAKWLEEKSLDQGWQALGGTKPAGKEIGEDASNALAKMGRDEGIIVPYASAKEMKANLAPIKQAQGETIGALRKEGDLAGAAPELDDILAKADSKYGRRFSKGKEAGSKREFLRAKDDVNELRPSTPKTIQEPALVQEPSAGPQQMELVDRGFAELFPKNPSESTLRTVMNDVPNPAYPAARPTTTDLAAKATDMNAFARNEKNMLRPNTATTKMADVVSSMNDTNLVQSLGSTKGQQYVEGLDRFGKLEDANQLLEGLRAGQKVGNDGLPMSRLGMLSQGVNKIAPSSARTHWYHKLSQKLQTDPQSFGRNRDVLFRAMKDGKASLNSTIYMLQQQDPEFKEEFAEMNRQ